MQCSKQGNSTISLGFGKDSSNGSVYKQLEQRQSRSRQSSGKSVAIVWERGNEVKGAWNEEVAMRTEESRWFKRLVKCYQ